MLNRGEIKNGLELVDIPAIVEPCDGFLKADKGLLAKELVTRKGDVPLRLMNLSDTPQVIHKGKRVGNITPIEEIVMVHSGDRSENTLSFTI